MTMTMTMTMMTTIFVLHQAPVMSRLPAFATISEGVQQQLVVLGNISITDRDNSTWEEKYTLDIQPSNNNLKLEYDAHNSKFEDHQTIRPP